MTDPYPPTITSLTIDLHRNGLRLINCMRDLDAAKRTQESCATEGAKIVRALYEAMVRQSKDMALVPSDCGPSLLVRMENGIPSIYEIEPESQP